MTYCPFPDTLFQNDGFNCFLKTNWDTAVSVPDRFKIVSVVSISVMSLSLMLMCLCLIFATCNFVVGLCYPIMTIQPDISILYFRR